MQYFKEVGFLKLTKRGESNLYKCASYNRLVNVWNNLPNKVVVNDTLV